MIKTVAEALEWVRTQQIAMAAAKVGHVPSLAVQIAGPVKGSWWSHPKGKLIFQIASAVEDHAEVLTCKLVEGKTTFVHQALWPSLLRVVLDEGWRTARIATLPPGAKKLLQRVEREGELRGVQPRSLEGSQLALVMSQHSDKGHHEKVVTAWKTWAQRSGVKPSKESVDEAIEVMRKAAGGTRVL